MKEHLIIVKPHKRWWSESKIDGKETQANAIERDQSKEYEQNKKIGREKEICNQRLAASPVQAWYLYLITPQTSSSFYHR